MKKELVSVFALVLLAVSVVLGILLLNDKRQLATLTRQSSAPVVGQVTPTKEVKLPAVRTYASPIALPAPKLRGTLSVEQAINERRTQRSFKDAPLTLAQVSQMLWSAQGITDAKTGKRAAPSAREVYPFTVYALVRNVTGLAPGLYEYLPKEHALGDMKLADASNVFNGAGVEEGAKKTPIVFILTAAMDKGLPTLKAGAVSSAYLEGGHIGENMYLEAQSLKIGLVVMGGTGTAGSALKIDPAETVVYVIPAGIPMPAVKEIAK